jgi:hypothetical protein
MARIYNAIATYFTEAYYVVSGTKPVWSPPITTNESRVTRLVLVDGMPCAGKCELLYEMKSNVKKSEYNVYHQNEFVELSDALDVMAHETKEELLRIGKIPIYYAENRIDELLDLVQKSINYQFKRGSTQIAATLKMCTKIEADRRQATTVVDSRARLSTEGAKRLFRLQKPVVIFMNGGIFTPCALMLGLLQLCPVRPDMSAKTRAIWYNLAQLAERNCRKLITALLKAIQTCTTDLDVCGAMFGVLNGENSLHTVVSEIVAHAYKRDRPWDKVYRESSNAIATNITKSFCVAWWTGARMLFGNYLPYSDEASTKQTGCRRLGRDVCSNDGLWGAILTDLMLVTTMSVRTSLDWYRPKSHYTNDNAASS